MYFEQGLNVTIKSGFPWILGAALLSDLSNREPILNSAGSEEEAVDVWEEDDQVPAARLHRVHEEQGGEHARLWLVVRNLHHYQENQENQSAQREVSYIVETLVLLL